MYTDRCVLFSVFLFYCSALFLCQQRQNHPIKSIILSKVKRTNETKFNIYTCYDQQRYHHGEHYTTKRHYHPGSRSEGEERSWFVDSVHRFTALLLGLGLAFYAGQIRGGTSLTRGATTASLTMSSNEAVFESSMLTTTNKNTKPLAASRIVPPRKK